MSRLIDDLRGRDARIQMPHWTSPTRRQAWADHVKLLSKVLANPQLPVVLIDNVAEYFYGCDQEHWDLREHFPNLAPPWPQFWCEWKMPRVIHSKEAGDTDMTAWVPHGRAGALITAATRDDVKGEGIPQEAKWIYWGEVFIDYGQRGVTAQGGHGMVTMCVDAEGRVIDAPWIQTFTDTSDERAVEIIRDLGAWLHPVWLAVSFLHCRNVTVVENQPDKPLAKKYHMKHGVRPTPWKTLVIEPLQEVLRREGGQGSHGQGNTLAKAMHICRGHFKDYREGRGLFGKYHQLVWQPSIIRGTKGRAAGRREVEVKV